MFIIFDKSQITSYFISIGTVVFLFVLAFFITKNPDTVETVANEQICINNIENNILKNSQSLKNQLKN